GAPPGVALVVVGSEDASPDQGDGPEDAVEGVVEEVGVVGDPRPQAREHELHDPGPGARQHGSGVAGDAPQEGSRPEGRPFGPRTGRRGSFGTGVGILVVGAAVVVLDRRGADGRHGVSSAHQAKRTARASWSLRDSPSSVTNTSVSK